MGHDLGMRGRLGWVFAVLVAVLAAGSALVLWDREHPLADEYGRAAAATADGDWAAAFSAFSRVVDVDPEYGDARRQLEAAALHLVANPAHDLAIEMEVDLLRWLVASGDDAGLAGFLDESTVQIPGGWGDMGSDRGHRNERPVRSVYLDGFAIDRYEVTNAQYQWYVAASGEPAPPYWTDGEYPPQQADYPVLGVSWDQATGYCRWAGKRLPTEAEWERACRGFDGLIYPWGDTWDGSLANIEIEPLPDRDDAWPLLAVGAPVGSAFPEPVGTRLGGASPSGVLDLCGNAAEWVADWYDPFAYSRLPAKNPIGPGPPADHVIRGSAWLYPHASPEYVPDISRCAFRNDSHVYADPRIGFRCAESG
jgi:formylglycine-generating enzyme required for sulfatase activity